jgi:UDP-N-acetylglucosamine 1-carboxyvinyltransferase
MDKLSINGGAALKGTIKISGAKNAALPLLTCGLLTSEPLELTNVPQLADITSMVNLLEDIGVTTNVMGHTITLQTPSVKTTTAAYDLVRKMRASILVLGPLLARFGSAKVSLPGGCAIGTRPVDVHIEGLKALGATIEIEEGYIVATTPNGHLTGGEYTFPVISVTGTENILMAATLAKGTTVLHNCAIEPEVNDVANCLEKMGARISGIGSRTMTIEGVDALNGAAHRVISDRIEAGTYAIAALITNGEIILEGAHKEHLTAFIEVLESTGAHIEGTDGGLLVRRATEDIRPIDVTTAPFPGFPTDLQAQMMTLLCLANGTSKVTETIFENRFMHAPELARMGAKIQVDGSTASITGVQTLKGAPVMATDLRASVSLVLAALVAKGRSDINRIYHLDRGYEMLEDKLSACGAKIVRHHDAGEDTSDEDTTRDTTTLKIMR